MKRFSAGLLLLAVAGCSSPKEGLYGVWVDYEVKDEAGNPVEGAHGLMRVFEDDEWADGEIAPTGADGRGQAVMGFMTQPLTPPTEWEIWISRDKSALAEEVRETRAVRVHYPGDFTMEDRVSDDPLAMNRFFFKKTIVLPAGK